MNRFCSFLTAASLFIHALLGCCWHHAHHSLDCGQTISLAVYPAVFDSACCCRHDGDDDDGDHPCRCPLECGGTCVYVSPERLQVDSPLQWNPLDLVPAIPMRGDAELAATTWLKLYGPPGPRLPVPPHHLDQVLLI
ncbi:MAG TPA: hypothetical protein VND64_11060 [Pirellulales bacterium]|nr:hypothetical protein [Pirellulales bacterium]